MRCCERLARFAAQGVGDSAFVGQNQLFPFSTVVFTSWDFHLNDVAASRNLRSSIRNQLKEMVNDAALDDVVHTFRARALSVVGKARVSWRLLLVGGFRHQGMSRGHPCMLRDRWLPRCLQWHTLPLARMTTSPGFSKNDATTLACA